MEYPKPSFTADVCVYAGEGDALSVLLIRRGREPFLNDWALPGGFVLPSETVEAAAARELLEETGVSGLSLEPVGVFSEPGRDPRGWTVTSVYRSHVDRRAVHARGMDDAAEARWFRLTFAQSGNALRLVLTDDHKTLTASLSDPYRAAGQLRWKRQSADGIAFDHAKILAAALYENRSGGSDEL